MLAYRKRVKAGLYNMIFIDFPGKVKGTLGTISWILPYYTFKVIIFSFKTLRIAYTVFFQVSFQIFAYISS